MPFRWGLDLGTASVAAAAVEIDDSDRELRFADWWKVRTFDEPIESGKGKPIAKKAKRRDFRLRRKQIARRSTRLKDIAELASLIGLDANKILPDQGQHLPRLRADASSWPVSLENLMRIFLRLAKKRGYYGEFKKPKEKSKRKQSQKNTISAKNLNLESQIEKGEGTLLIGDEVRGGSLRLEHVIERRAAELEKSSLTLGQYLYDRHQRGLPTKLKIHELDGKKSIQQKEADYEKTNLYALNKLVREEFDHIWTTQEQFHPILKGSASDGTLLKDIFAEKIFHKRPLRSVADMVGFCPLELRGIRPLPSEHQTSATNRIHKQKFPRAPRAQPDYQEFRIEKLLTDLRWGMGKKATLLCSKQKDAIRNLLNSHKEIDYPTIYETLVAENCPKPEGKALNIAQKGRDRLLGNTTLSAIRALGDDIEKKWCEIDRRTQIQVINFLADLGSPEQLLESDWHNQFAGQGGQPRQFCAPFIEFIECLKTHSKYGRLSAMGFESGRTSYSIKALRRLTGWLKSPEWAAETPPEDRRIDEEAAINQCYQPVQPPKLEKELAPHPPTGSDIVDVALRQVQGVINEGLRTLGRPHEIIIELGREMTEGLTKRGETLDAIKYNEGKRSDAAKAIENAGGIATDFAITRYLHWEEQNHKCPYCQDKNHLSIHDALDGSYTDHEHIIVQSLTQVRRRRSEIVLSHKACNDAKGNQTPLQAWGNGIAPDRESAVLAMADHFERLAKSPESKDKSTRNRLRRKAHLLRLANFEAEVLTDESITGFADRQMQQTSRIALLVAEWVRSICPRVFVARGELTAHFRRCWGLDTAIPEIRFGEGLPVCAEDGKRQRGKQITQEEFGNYRHIWEGRPKEKPGVFTSLRIYKRIDHRHHLVDACVIALSKRSRFVEFARHYKEQSEIAARENQRTQLRLRPPPPFTDLRAQVLEILKNPNLSHRPDHYVAGAFFEEQPYSLTAGQGGDDPQGEKDWLTKRFKLKDLTDQNDKTGDKARRNIKEIVSADSRRFVLAEFENRLAAGETPLQALSRPILRSKYPVTPIWRVKVRCEEHKRVHYQIVHKGRDPRDLEKSVKHSHWWNFAGYAYMDIDKTISPPKLRLVSRYEALDRKRSGEPIIAPKGHIRLFRGDTIKDTRTGYLYVVVKFSAGQGENPKQKAICIRYTETASNLDKVKQSEGRMDFDNERMTYIEIINPP